MEVRKGYKQTEIGIIPEEWKLVELRNLAKYRRGSFPQPYGLSKWYDDVTGNPFIQVVDVDKNFKLKPETKKRLSAEAEKMSVFAPKGSVILSLNGSVGRVALTQYDGFIDRTLLLFESFSIPIDRHYFIYAVSAVFHEEEKKAPGAILKTITKEHLSNFLLPVPTLAEQEAIAEALSDADALIESLETLLAKKRQVKQGAMSELLSGKRRLPGFSGEWKEKKLSDICWYQEGPGVRTWQFTKSGIKLLNGTNIFRGEINLDNTDRFISENLAYGQYAHFMADSGDIVIASSGITVEKFEEKVAFVRDEHLPLCMNTSTIRFKANKNVLQSSFLYFLLMSDMFKKQIGHQATGSAQLNFGPAHLNKVLFKLPDLPEQTAIAEILSDMDAEIRAVEEKLSKARGVKAGMMSALLTGRIRLNHD
jgi:type I restriction enzyme, S subunit